YDLPVRQRFNDRFPKPLSGRPALTETSAAVEQNRAVWHSPPQVFSAEPRRIRNIIRPDPDLVEHAKFASKNKVISVVTVIGIIHQSHRLWELAGRVAQDLSERVADASPICFNHQTGRQQS